MFIDYPEAFTGFTIQPMVGVKFRRQWLLFTWTIAEGLKAEGDNIVGGEAERLCLLGLYIRMEPYIGQRDPMGVVAGLRESLVQENEERITIAAHRHRHGTSLIAYRSKRDLLEEDIIELLGEDFESGRDDEYIEEIRSSSIKGIEYIEV